MAEDPFDVDRKVLAAAIRTLAARASNEIGKSSFDERVLAAMTKVPRHEFVPVEAQGLAYANVPLPIGYGKTTTQPFMVAVMTDLVEVHPDDAVLEIGTGLGYQAAILAELAGVVYTVELNEDLARSAKQRLKKQGCKTSSCGSAMAFTAGPSMRPLTRSSSRPLPTWSHRAGRPHGVARRSAASPAPPCGR